MTTDSPGTAPTFTSQFAALPASLHSQQAPTPVSSPALLRLNDALAKQLQCDADWLRSSAGVNLLSGNQLPTDTTPVAMAYAGHQFGNWVPQLGDGRAILIGELPDVHGVLQEVQLKGAGRTPFSRGGDGRAWLGPVLREYVISEAMHALGIPTTRALAAVSTGDNVLRESPLPGAILTRVNRSHVRVGTFQYFMARQDTDALHALTQHVMERHYPDIADAENRPLALLDAVMQRQAKLIAHWQGIGFIHGVMNTDNMSVTGDTIDYGPCAFMDTYNAEQVYSSIDVQGRYAFRNQPGIGHWNLACLAQALMPIIADEQDRALALVQDTIDTWPSRWAIAYRGVMLQKLGLLQVAGKAADAVEIQADDDALIADLLTIMQNGQADHTMTFRSLGLIPQIPSTTTVDGDRVENAFLAQFAEPADATAWLVRWRQRLSEQNEADTLRQQRMQACNPAFIPRNHQVERMIEAAVKNDLAPFHALVDVLSTPFTDQPDKFEYMLPPEPDEVVPQTFCGT